MIVDEVQRKAQKYGRAQIRSVRSWWQPFEHKKHVPLQERKKDAEEIRARDRVPIIVEKAARSTVPEIEKKKFEVAEDVTVAEFLYQVRQLVALGPEQSLFLLVNHSIPHMQAPMGHVHQVHKDPEDGFLYIRYSGENTFGGKT